MNGKTIKEIEDRFNEIKDLLTQKFPDKNIEIIDSLWRGIEQSPVWCLGYGITKLSEADIVVFDKGWRDARGCKVEYDVCSYYGFKFMEI